MSRYTLTRRALLRYKPCWSREDVDEAEAYFGKIVKFSTLLRCSNQHVNYWDKLWLINVIMLRRLGYVQQRELFRRCIAHAKRKHRDYDAELYKARLDRGDVYIGHGYYGVVAKFFAELEKKGG